MMTQHRIITQVGKQSRLCTLSYTALQRALYKATFSQGQTRPAPCVQGHSAYKDSRDREAPLREGVPHFMQSSESHLVMGGC